VRKDACQRVLLTYLAVERSNYSRHAPATLLWPDHDLLTSGTTIGSKHAPATNLAIDPQLFTARLARLSADRKWHGHTHTIEALSFTGDERLLASAG